MHQVHFTNLYFSVMIVLENEKNTDMVYEPGQVCFQTFEVMFNFKIIKLKIK